MCCGAGVENSGAGVEQPRRAPRPALSAPGGPKREVSPQHGSLRGGATQAPRQPIPRYCPDHEVSEQRQKGEPRSVECRGCRAPLQTNYVHFSFCPKCSEKEHKCMYCGADAASLAQTFPAGTSADASAGPPPPPPWQPDAGAIAGLPPPPPWQPDPFEPLKSFGPAIGPDAAERDELDMSSLKLGESMRLEEHGNVGGNSVNQPWFDRQGGEASKPFGASFGHADEPSDRRVGRQRSSSMPYRSSQVHPGPNPHTSLPGLPDREAPHEHWGPSQWAMRPPRRSHQQLRHLAAMEC